MAWMGRDVHRTKESSVDGPGHCGPNETRELACGSLINQEMAENANAMMTNFGLVEQGTKLFEQFIQLYFGEGIPQSSPSGRVPFPVSDVARGDQNLQAIGSTYSNLSQLMHSVSHSAERRKVKELANTIDLDLSPDDLGAILAGILSDSKDTEDGVLLVACFCVDIGMRLLSSGLRPYMEVLKLGYRIMQLTMKSSGSMRPRDDWEGTEIN